MNDFRHKVSAALFASLDLNLLVGIVQVTGSLEGRSTETGKRLESVDVTTFADVPSGRLGAEVDLDHHDQGRDSGRREHPAPLGVLALDVADGGGGVLESDRDDLGGQ